MFQLWQGRGNSRHVILSDLKNLQIHQKTDVLRKIGQIKISQKQNPQGGHKHKSWSKRGQGVET